MEREHLGSFLYSKQNAFDQVVNSQHNLYGKYLHKECHWKF